MTLTIGRAEIALPWLQSGNVSLKHQSKKEYLFYITVKK
jgi:hypothetical protein